MLVDDSEEMLAVYTHILHRENYRVLRSRSGAEALEMLTAEAPDLIVLDYMMPGMSGRDVLARLRAEPRTQRIPVVILTAAEVDRASLTWAFSLGAVDYCQKPITSKLLRERVAAMIARARDA